jgi:HK97 family phage major capsid protein
MLLLTATSTGHSPATDPNNRPVTGELLLPAEMCDHAHCLCRREFVGVTSHSRTLHAQVVDLDVNVDQLRDIARRYPVSLCAPERLPDMTNPQDDYQPTAAELEEAVRSEIRAELRDMSTEQAGARLSELSRFTRPLSRRQSIERQLLVDQTNRASRIMAMIADGTISNVIDGPRDMTTGQPLPPAGPPNAGLPPAGHGGWITGSNVDPRVQQYRTAGMNTIQRYQVRNVLNARAADRLDKVLREGDGQGLTARYLAAAGNEHYDTAFAKMLADPQMGHLRFRPDEVNAVREAGYVQEQHRIMNAALTTGATGFILPITWDPTITLTGTGALNPVRDIADVVTVGTHDWQGVTADSVTAAYVQEGVESTDATPTLVGPKISTQQGRAFAQFTIEASQDWDTLSAQLQGLVADAKNTVDATMFLTGSGVNQPSGILNIGALNGLTTTQRVQTTTVATYAVGDPWLLKAQIPARFVGDATFAANPNTWDTTYRFVAQGSTTEPRQFSDGDRGGDFLGRPKVEWSTMGTGATTGTKLIIGGNFKGYKIVDRLGLTAELIPHMLGATRLPLGVRGLYCYWRTGAGVISPNHFRYLEVK